MTFVDGVVSTLPTVGLFLAALAVLAWWGLQPAADKPCDEDES